MLAITISSPPGCGQARGDGPALPRLGPIPLRFQHHRGLGIERPRLQPHEHAGARPPPAACQRGSCPTARPTSTTIGDGQRHHVADAKGVALEERVPGQRR